MSLRERFGGDIVDWSGLEVEHICAWHKQLHIFEVPFYYIEYAIAQLGALQVWQNMHQDKEAVLSAYRNGLSLGGSRPLPELFTAANIRFDFSEETIAPLMTAVEKQLQL